MTPRSTAADPQRRRSDGRYRAGQLSADYPSDALFRSSVAIENLHWIENDAEGARPFAQTPKAFGGLSSPKWPSQIFGDDQAWQIKQDRVTNGRKLYADLCSGCHLGPVNDPTFDAQFPEKSIWSSPLGGQRQGRVLDLVQINVKGTGTDPEQSACWRSEPFRCRASSTCSPRSDLANWWWMSQSAGISSTDMPYSLALMEASTSSAGNGWPISSSPRAKR